MTRVRLLPDQGTLILNTDVHGNLIDFERVRSIYETCKASDPETYWVILGDVVHGPSEEARGRMPELYDYDDGSFEIVEQIAELVSDDPEHIIFVLGNHDHAHVGGPRTRKFYTDEAEALEETLSIGERTLLRETLSAAALAVYAPCGLAMTHASPGRVFRSLDEINRIQLDPNTAPARSGVVEAQRSTIPGSQKSAVVEQAQQSAVAEQAQQSAVAEQAQQTEILRHLLRCYGQNEDDSRLYLQSISALLPFEVTTVIHGHDRDPVGFFIQEETQFCPVIFGAPQNNKRYLHIDLAARFQSPYDLRDGVEIRRLY